LHTALAWILISIFLAYRGQVNDKFLELSDEQMVATQSASEGGHQCSIAHVLLKHGDESLLYLQPLKWVDNAEM
jgi:hypothetical protein